MRKASKVFSVVFIRIGIVYTIGVYTLKYLLLGYRNANKYLESISHEYIIPILKLFGATIGNNCDIQSGIIFHNCTDFKRFTIGSNTHIGKNCFFDLRDKISIGDNVVVSMQTTFVTHIDLTNSILSKQYPADQSGIKINNDVYIGVGSTVLMGVLIEHSSFIAAKTLVNSDVEAHTMVGGVPSRVIKQLDVRI